MTCLEIAYGVRFCERLMREIQAIVKCEIQIKYCEFTHIGLILKSKRVLLRLNQY
jgi:hypothetical protein